METIGQRLKKYREDKEVSQLELSKNSGISKSYISEIESGKYSNISIGKLCKFCKVLKLTPNDLIPEHYWRDWIGTTYS